MRKTICGKKDDKLQPSERPVPCRKCSERGGVSQATHCCLPTHAGNKLISFAGKFPSSSPPPPPLPRQCREFRCLLVCATHPERDGPAWAFLAWAGPGLAEGGWVQELQLGLPPPFGGPGAFLGVCWKLGTRPCVQLGKLRHRVLLSHLDTRIHQVMSALPPTG